MILHLGINASCVTHLESSKPELRQLRKVTDIDKRKLRGLANKEMVDEILKVKSMATELKKYQRGRGRGKKRSQIHEACEVFGQGTGHIWMENVKCLGREPSITMCPHSGWGQTHCSHDKDVGVICETEQTNKTGMVSQEIRSNRNSCPNM